MMDNDTTAHEDGANPVALAASLHGAIAARRQAITELLFFASIGDAPRCKYICATWNLDPSDPTVCDYDQRTPLHLAASEGCHTVASWLLACKANVNALDRFKHTPVEDAVRFDHGEVVSLLVAAGGKVYNKPGDELVELVDTPLSGTVRIHGELDPEWEVDPQQLRMMKKVGEGEFGVVYKAKYLGTIVAVKILKNRNKVALGDFRTELNVLHKVHHAHCLQFFGAVTKSEPFMIITEFMACGSLADMFRDKEAPSLRRAVQLALDMARGMTYLHHHHPLAIIHRDLKPANLMIGGTAYVESDIQRKLLQHELGVVKIADFGLSKSLKLVMRGERNKTGAGSTLGAAGGSEALPPAKHQQHSYKLTGETGSYRYMAPEVFRHECYNHKVDQYSFAMILYQLFQGVVPFKAYNALQAARLAAQGERPEWDSRAHRQVPSSIRHLVERCWHDDFEQRPEFLTVISELDKVLAKLPMETPMALRTTGDACCSLQ